MSDIQVDMYPVGLGSAMLVQFSVDGECVRILADGGIDHHKDVNTVHDALVNNQDLKDSEDGVRLDLVIGTHYDFDHLSGLVPIISDPKFDIGEVWLPPVVDDTATSLEEGGPVSKRALLVHRFANPEMGRKALQRYLNKKQQICVELIEAIHDICSEDDQHSPVIREMRGLASDFNRSATSARETGELTDAFFRSLERQASSCIDLLSRYGDDVAFIDEELGHGDQSWMYPPTNWDDEEDDFTRKPLSLWFERSQTGSAGHLEGARVFRGIITRNRRRAYALADLGALLAFTKGQARDAINAKCLSDVVNAIYHRNQMRTIKIKIRCRIIPTGTPYRFIWNKSTRIFTRSQHSHSSGPILMLLAPSDTLVRKHLKRLPIGSYAMRLAYFDYSLKSITPSNQLSYVIRAEYLNQGILIAGDTGLVDFIERIRPRKYRQAMLDALLPLHVVQVAHHGGNNWYFYHVLMEAGYDGQPPPTFLLLSHDVYDRNRPSDVFEEFMQDLDGAQCDAKVLFTSRPQASRVQTFRHMIAPISAPASDEGYIRLKFDHGRWSTVHHLISP